MPDHSADAHSVPEQPPYGTILAPFACTPELCRGRLHGEPESSFRSPFQRDRDRVIHSGAFRRMKHKTQVFVYHEGDYFRTRLTHSLEVAQITRTICRNLGLNEDLAEAVALAHDLGHTPFGHAGEEALDAAMANYGGFDHNAQTLRILTKLEQRYVRFDGLNLTWETLEGVVKHNGPLTGPHAGSSRPLPVAITEYIATHDLELSTFAGPEAQIAALADDIAYNSHDLDDGLRAGLFDIDAIADLPLVGPALAKVRREYPDVGRSRHIHEVIRCLIGDMVADLLSQTRERIDASGAKTAAEIRALDHPVGAFSAGMLQTNVALKKFLFTHMYRHHRVNRMTSKARRVVKALFDLFLAEPELLTPEWRGRAEGREEHGRARVIADYIAGMTDRYALDTYAELFQLEKTN
ncbi:MAG: deoxyguanosinetriphosphate triphosphohydrolase [Alphaproteobacteria bacterium]